MNEAIESELDFEERQKLFLEEYEKLVKKYQVWVDTSEWSWIGDFENNNELRTLSGLSYDELPDKELTPSVRSDMIEREIKRHIKDLQD